MDQLLAQQFTQLLERTKMQYASSTDSERALLKLSVLGRKGELTRLFDQLSTLPAAKRAELGKLANQVKRELQTLMTEQEEQRGRINPDQLIKSYTWKARSHATLEGHPHPLRIFTERVTDLFTSLGYDVLDSPELEDERYNFDLLNIPKDHPARDEWDTFFVRKGKKQDSILRTHTSPMQVRSMKTRKPPVRVIVPGRVFRHEASDASHGALFIQCEGFLIDKGITLRDLMGTLDICIKGLFGSKIQTRFRPHYYPFVEPGMDVDMKFKGSWLEVLGSGMIHPKVLINMGVDPNVWSGFAFGLGIDRLAMLYWGIDDIRLLYSGDMRFAKQFHSI